MHGYTNTSDRSKGVGIFIGEAFDNSHIEELKLTQLLPFFRSALGLMNA